MTAKYKILILLCILLPAALHAEELQISYYAPRGCRSCETFYHSTLPGEAERLGVSIRTQFYDIYDPKVYEVISSRLASLGKPATEFPVLQVNDQLLQGDEEIAKHLEAVLNGEYHTQKGALDNQVRFLVVFLAGLADGVNPCVFTTLVFFLSVLGMAGKERKEMCAIGLFYGLGVAGTYYLIGLGLLNGVRILLLDNGISNIVTVILVVLLCVCAGLSLYDYIMLKRGAPGKTILSLNTRQRTRVHTLIRTFRKKNTLYFGSVVLGSVVSIAEMGCSGQVYVPTLTYIARSGDIRGYLLLTVYNAAFILPLVALFLVIFFGISHETIVRYSRRHIQKGKLILAGVFLIMAAVTVYMG